MGRIVLDYMNWCHFGSGELHEALKTFLRLSELKGIGISRMDIEAGELFVFELVLPAEFFKKYGFGKEVEIAKGLFLLIKDIPEVSEEDMQKEVISVDALLAYDPKKYAAPIGMLLTSDLR